MENKMKNLLNPKAIIFVIAALIQLSSFASKAGDIKILTLKNVDRNVNFELFIKGDENLNAVGLRLYDHEDKKWEDYDVSKLPRGVVVKQEGSHKVIVLQSRNFEKDRGGHFKIEFLQNGITGSKGRIALDFEFDGREWIVYYQGSKGERLDFNLNKVFGKVIGISKITPRFAK